MDLYSHANKYRTSTHSRQLCPNILIEKKTYEFHYLDMLKSDPSRMNSERLARSRTIIIVIICAGIFFVTLNLGVAHGQENSTTAIREIQIILNNQTHDLGVIKNITSAQNKVLEKVTTSLSKSATQGAYTALSVFFLGIALGSSRA